MSINLSKAKKIYSSLSPKVVGPSKYVPFSFLLGRTYRDAFNRIEDFHQLDQNQQISCNINLLLEYCNYAIANIPFYRDFARKKSWSKVSCYDQFLELPLIDKDQITGDLSWFSNSSLPSYLVTTGGTTGKQTKLYMSNYAYKVEWAYVAHLLKEHGANINSNKVSFRGVYFGQNYKKPYRYNPIYKELQVSPFKLNHESFDEIQCEVLKNKPKIIHGYPSSVSEYARLVLKFGDKLRGIDLVLLVSEPTTEDQVDVIKKAFGCKVITFYGMTERLVFAGGEVGESLKCDLSYGYTEVDGGQLVGTGFLNRATCLLRYKTGDEVNVSCKNGVVVELNDVVGRWGRDYLVGRSGVKIYMTSLNVHSNMFDDIKKYQFHQTNKGECKLYLVPEEGAEVCQGELDKISKYFMSKVSEEVVFEAVSVDDIELTERGKHQFIKNDYINEG